MVTGHDDGSAPAVEVGADEVGTPGITGAVRAAYAALARGDADALLELLSDDFVAVVSDGLPAPIGGRHDGPRSMVDDGWWEIGRRFRVRAHPEQWIPTADGRLLVIGHYVGRHRAADIPIDAAFAHLWTWSGGRLSALQQITDTVAWGLGP